MNKKIIAIAAVVVILVCAVAIFGREDLSQNSQSSNASTEIAEATVTPSVELDGSDTTDVSALPVEEYVTLGDYKSLKINVTKKEELDDATIEENVLGYFFEDAQSLAPEAFVKEGTVKLNDVILLDYEGKKDGVAFEGGTAADATLAIGSGQFIDGFEDGLIGVSVGETVDLNLTFPEGYSNAELAGQAVVFTVTVKGIAGLEDATIKNIGLEGIETVDSYREAVETTLLYNIESNYYNNLSLALAESLLANNTVSKLPKAFYENQKNAIISQIQAQCLQYGFNADEYTQMFMGMGLADYAVVSAEEYTKQALIYQAIANAEGLQVTQEEVDTFVADYVANYGASYGLETVEQFYQYNKAEDVKIVLLQDKIVTFFEDNGSFVETE